MWSQASEQRKSVVLGAAGSGNAFAIASRIRAVWGEDVFLVGVDINPPNMVTTSILCDAFVQVPPCCDALYLDVVADVCLTYRTGLFIPLLNDEMRWGEKLLKRIPDLKILGFSPKGADLVGDKLLQSRWLAEQSVPTPPTMLPVDLDPSRGPWFVKPRNGFGSRGAFQLESAEVRNLIPGALNGMVVQPLCGPPEVTVDSFYDHLNGFVRTICRERLEVKSGVCTKARLFNDPTLASYAERIGSALQYRGAFCFQVMRLDEKWAVTDLNLRPGAGTAMTVAAGQDVIAAALACSWGEPYERFFSEGGLQNGLIVTRQYSEFVMASA